MRKFFSLTLPMIISTFNVNLVLFLFITLIALTILNLLRRKEVEL